MMGSHRFSGDRMLPTFLGLGAARCASTWLYHILKLHPQILMTSEKEVSFFGKNCLKMTWADYQRSFSPPPEKINAPVRGDISPWYVRLTARQVESVHRLLPNARLVLVIRNPIERMWSHAVMEFARGTGGEDFPLDASRFMRRFERLRLTRDSNYLRTIENWTAHYGESALRVELYDRLLQDPASFLRDILLHIGADARWTVTRSQLTTHRWSMRDVTGGKFENLEMPEMLRWYLALQWREPMRRLNERLGGRVSKWLEEIETIAGRRAPMTWQARRLLNRSLIVWPERISYAMYEKLREIRLARAYARIEEEAAASKARESSPISTSRNHRRNFVRETFQCVPRWRD